MPACPEYVSRLVDTAPPLDAAQRDVILSAFAGLRPEPEVKGRAA